MSPLDLVRTAVANSLRSRTRTALTALAIFIGAFTLTLTSAIGTGINSYIDTTLSAMGSDDVMTVTKTVAEAADGPQLYDPNSALVEGGFGGEVEAITSSDIEALMEVSGVEGVTPALQVSVDWVATNGGDQYQAHVGSMVPGMQLELAAGAQIDYSAGDFQVAIPVSYVTPLGFASAQEAVGADLTISLTDAEGHSHDVVASIVAVTEPGLLGGSSMTPNDALAQQLYDNQSVGLTTAEQGRYAQVSLRYDDATSSKDVTAMRDEIGTLGYDTETFDEQLGAFRTVIDAVVLVLNGFAVIALLAAGFGIVNTLLMSVQERTREIGLMKAVGMPGTKIFGLFSLEAAFIGLLGSAMGVVGGIALGVGINSLLAGGLLADLPGLVLFGFNPASLALIVLGVMAIAFLAGTIPAYRAARKDPITALRYE